MRKIFGLFILLSLVSFTTQAEELNLDVALRYLSCFSSIDDCNSYTKGAAVSLNLVKVFSDKEREVFYARWAEQVVLDGLSIDGQIELTKTVYKKQGKKVFYNLDLSVWPLGNPKMLTQSSYSFKSLKKFNGVLSLRGSEFTHNNLRYYPVMFAASKGFRTPHNRAVDSSLLRKNSHE